jgi:hypothetical protein
MDKKVHQLQNDIHEGLEKETVTDPGRVADGLTT